MIDLVGRVFSSNDKSQRDIFTTSIIALLLCAPTRISEVLSLEVDCEVEGKDKEGKEPMAFVIIVQKAMEKV